MLALFDKVGSVEGSWTDASHRPLSAENRGVLRYPDCERADIGSLAPPLNDIAIGCIPVGVVWNIPCTANHRFIVDLIG
jgi:hypothetical protein